VKHCALVDIISC